MSISSSKGGSYSSQLLKDSSDSTFRILGVIVEVIRENSEILAEELAEDSLFVRTKYGWVHEEV